MGFDPTSDGGPNATPVGCTSATYWSPYFDTTYADVDWTHTNSIAASNFGSSEVLNLSLRQWDQILQLDASSGSLIWKFANDPTYSDFGTLDTSAIFGATDFHGQHGTHSIDENKIMMLDNHSAMDPTRVLAVDLDPVGGASAVEYAWTLLNAGGSGSISCAAQGSAEAVDWSSSTNVLAMCSAAHVIEELSVNDGSVPSTPPPLRITLGSPFCSGMGPAPTNIKGWYRAFPLDRVGEY